MRSNVRELTLVGFFLSTALVATLEFSAATRPMDGARSPGQLVFLGHVKCPLTNTKYWHHGSSDLLDGQALVVCETGRRFWDANLVTHLAGESSILAIDCQAQTCKVIASQQGRAIGLVAVTDKGVAYSSGDKITVLEGTTCISKQFKGSIVVGLTCCHMHSKLAVLLRPESRFKADQTRLLLLDLKCRELASVQDVEVAGALSLGCSGNRILVLSRSVRSFEENVKWLSVRDGLLRETHRINLPGGEKARLLSSRKVAVVSTLQRLAFLDTDAVQFEHEVMVNESSCAVLSEDAVIFKGPSEIRMVDKEVSRIIQNREFPDDASVICKCGTNLVAGRDGEELKVFVFKDKSREGPGN